MSVFSIRSRIARGALVAATAVALTGGSVAGAQASTHSSVGAQRACAVNRAPGAMACMVLIRDGITQRTEAQLGHDSAPVGDGYGPSSLQSAYNLTSASSSKGAGESVAVVDAYNDPNAVSDVATYRSAWGLPACNTSTGAGCLSVVNQMGKASPLPTNSGSTGWATEESLDVDMVSAICPNCHIYLVEANKPNIFNLGTAVKSAVHKLHVAFVSNSYGGGTNNHDATYDTDYYQQPGAAITASAGDSGYGPAYPAASQYVTAVGGTSLVQAGAGRGWTETVWNGSGGGCTSAVEARPAWQSYSVTKCAHRLENDVAAVADPNTGVAIYDTYDQGGWLEVGGTSVASPIIASVFALGGTPSAGTYPVTDIYNNTSALYDVTVGTNGTCHKAIWCNAGAGYDGPTGWGTPDGTTAFTG